jgi:hypothetical protein
MENSFLLRKITYLLILTINAHPTNPSDGYIYKYSCTWAKETEGSLRMSADPGSNDPGYVMTDPITL